MRNRAKCKICRQIIESKTVHDYVTCPCGEISIDGGPGYLRCIAKDFYNFLRIDEDDNEIEVRLYDKKSIEEKKYPKIVVKLAPKNQEEPQEEQQEEQKEPQNALTKDEIMVLFDEMIGYIETMSDTAKLTSITHYDQLSLMLLLRSLFKSL